MLKGIGLKVRNRIPSKMTAVNITNKKSLSFYLICMFLDLSQRLLNIKKKLCEDLLEYLHCLGAGKSKMRAMLLYELYCCIREQYMRNHNEVIINFTKF